MPNKPRVGITLFIALAAFLAPILASAYLAWWESYATEKALSLANAQDVLRRMEETSEPIQGRRKETGASQSAALLAAGN